METVDDFNEFNTIITQLKKLSMLEVVMGVKRLMKTHTGVEVEKIKLSTDKDGNIVILIASSGRPSYKLNLEEYESESKVLYHLMETGMDFTTREIIHNVYPDKKYEDMISPVGGTLYRLWQQNLINKSGNKKDRKWCFNFGIIKLD